MLTASRYCLWLAAAGVGAKENTVQLRLKSKPSSKVKTEFYVPFQKEENQVMKIYNCEIFQKYDFSVCRSYSGRLHVVLLVLKFSFSFLKSVLTLLIRHNKSLSYNTRKLLQNLQYFCFASLLRCLEADFCLHNWKYHFVSCVCCATLKCDIIKWFIFLRKVEDFLWTLEIL